MAWEMTRVGGEKDCAPPPPPHQNLVKALAPSLECCYKPRLELTQQG